jgi:hypothetical protein
MGKEDLLQNRVMRYLDINYPDALFTHVSNEGKRTPFEQFKMRFLGTKKGVPDILIFTGNKKYSGLAIELKTGYNKPTRSQETWLISLKNCGWYVCWLNDYEQVITTINKYFNNYDI